MVLFRSRLLLPQDSPRTEEKDARSCLSGRSFVSLEYLEHCRNQAIDSGCSLRNKKVLLRHPQSRKQMAKRAVRTRPRQAVSARSGAPYFSRLLSKLLRGFRKLGPGIVTGAADDDPSGIATYSQIGAQFGFTMLWTMLLTYPLMAGIQEISAWLGRVTGMGIAANIRHHYAPALLYTLVALLSIANVINLGADIGAMGALCRCSWVAPRLPTRSCLE